MDLLNPRKNEQGSNAESQSLILTSLTSANDLLESFVRNYLNLIEVKCIHLIIFDIFGNFQNHSLMVSVDRLGSDYL